MAEEEVDEVEALRAEVAARHERLVRALLLVGAALVGTAGVLALVLPLENRPGLYVVPVGLCGFGLAAIARALYSRYSDVDTRPDKNLVGVHDDDGDEPDRDR